MNGPGAPQPDYLQMINQTLGGAPPAGPVMLGSRGGAAQPMPAPLPGGAPLPPPAPGPNMSAMPPPAPLASSAATPPPMPGPSLPAAAPPPPQGSFLQRVHGAMTVPAHEVEMRGPQLKAAQGDRNTAFEGAVQAVTERSQHTAAADYAVALEDARKAGVREDAANYTTAERANELAERQADFDQSTKALSKMSVDPDRFWANASTGTKVQSYIAVALAGLGNVAQSMRRGGNRDYRNSGLDAVNQMIDRDIKAQEFAYNASRDTVNAKQTAFSMAMQKYQNVDAARAAARAAALDVAVSQAGAQAALWKGTESANRANMAAAELSQDRANQIAQGVAFVQPRTAAASYVDPRTGLTYTDQEAKGLVKTMDEHAFEERKQGTGIAGQLMVEGSKAGQKDQDKTDEGTRFIAEKLQAAGVPQARAAADAAEAALNKSPGGKLEAVDRAIMPDSVSNAVHSNDSNAREQAYNNFKNAAMKAIFGNVTASEEARAEKQFGMANDPASRLRAIEMAKGMLDSIEKNARAGATPKVQEEYSKRRTAAEGRPPDAPKGSTHGWGGK